MSNNSFSPRAILGLVTIAAGAALAIFFWELQFLWFQGGPIGIALIVLGGLDLWDSYRRGRGKAPRGLLEELRDDLLGPSRDTEPRPKTDAATSAEPEPAPDEDADGEDSVQRR
jgi:hypothetical protein